MAVAPPSTHHSHLDPGDLLLRLTSRSSYGSKYRLAVDPTFVPKEKNREHVTRSGSCYRRDPSVKDSTLEIDNLDESVKYTAFLRGLRPTSKFAFSVNKSHPAIEALIKRGQLRKFVAPSEGRQQTNPAMEEREDREENAGTINTISGGLAIGGSSGQARKAYTREVCITNPPPNKKQKTVPVATITFSDDDSKDMKIPHDDPLVITIKVGNFDVKRVLTDNGSSAEILFYDAFKKMNIPTDRLRKMDAPLYGFSNHPVAAEDQPLRKVLLSPEASGRLVNWSVELGEFDIQYKPRTTIKAQALADFIVKCTLPEDPPQLVVSAVPDPWNLYVDSSSALGSSGAELILISPEGFTIEYALRFGFQASNNEAEYEALLAGIRLAHALKVDSLSVHSDSQLVVNHVLGDYEARDERMAKYLNLVKTSAVKFQNFTICQIPRDQNTQVGTLSRLASAEETDVRRPVYLEFLKDRSINSQAEIEIIEQEPCWMDMIITYLSTSELPSERHEARNLRVKAARYALV
ncbi:hypothetical protein RJ639_023191 [Escallonia herrerae]|uniref:RNase H type-1 domain-containing protein n=1 Tax=Escallonia herrerae TaxID=1293975 RepID=A0AA88UZ55_9ASTE|nr:hypothetical protein RJ639_023191 [Escallonia herrerae]